MISVVILITKRRLETINVEVFKS